ncbi:hypothetical protein ACFSVJ_07025 [Prauserella oleivorans]
MFRACAEHYGTDLRYAWRSFAAAAASPRRPSCWASPSARRFSSARG